MRITGGVARGFHVSAPRGSEVRPTSDRVRSAVFQLIEGAVEDAAVLDLYAGTGAVGIEALSRGASGVVFVEQDPRMCRAISRNLVATGFSERGKIRRAKVEGSLQSLGGPFDVALLDPPYGLPGVSEVLAELDNLGLIAIGGIVVIEHSRRESFNQIYGKLYKSDNRRYGDTVVSLYTLGT